jgi:hypothetical protein
MRLDLHIGDVIVTGVTNTRPSKEQLHHQLRLISQHRRRLFAKQGGSDVPGLWFLSWFRMPRVSVGRQNDKRRYTEPSDM